MRTEGENFSKDRGGTQDGTVFGQGLGASGVQGGAQFARDLGLVRVKEELVEQMVGSFELEDMIGGRERGLASYWQSAP